VVQLQLSGLMISKECGAVRADLIDLIARVIAAVFHEGRGNDRARPTGSVMRYSSCSPSRTVESASGIPPVIEARRWGGSASWIREATEESHLDAVARVCRDHDVATTAPR
jgi:hypothetical protein